MIDSLETKFLKSNFSQEEKIVMMVILIAIMEADGIIDPGEVAYLDEMVKLFGMTDETMDLLSEADYNQYAEYFRKFDGQKKTLAIALFKGMAISDGYADPRELSIIESLG